MELRPYNISVTLSLPPDTDTPGFAIEELSKPLETRLISQTSGLVSPDVVANKLFRDALVSKAKSSRKAANFSSRFFLLLNDNVSQAGKFFSIVGLEGFILATLCSGMSPFKSIGELLLQASLMGLLRIVGAFYLISFDKIILDCLRTRDKNKKSE